MQFGLLSLIFGLFLTPADALSGICHAIKPYHMSYNLGPILHKSLYSPYRVNHIIWAILYDWIEMNSELKWTVLKIYIKDIFCGFFHSPQQKYVGKESIGVRLHNVWMNFEEIAKQGQPFW